MEQVNQLNEYVIMMCDYNLQLTSTEVQSAPGTRLVSKDLENKADLTEINLPAQNRSTINLYPCIRKTPKNIPRAICKHSNLANSGVHFRLIC